VGRVEDDPSPEQAGRGPAVLLIEDLTKIFPGPVLAVNRLSLSVSRGEVFGFLGPNGSGKTTTISMILGLIRPTGGRITLLGAKVAGIGATGARRILRRVGAVTERSSQYPYLSGRDNLAVAALELGGIPENAIDRVLDLVGLRDAGSRRAQTYSHGMRQRLGLAAALLNEPEILFLDEPTTGLDPAGQHEIRELIVRLAREGKTIFLCSHQLHEVEQVCSRVGVLKKGELIAEGAVEALLRHRSLIRVRVPDPPVAATALAHIDWIRDRKPDGAYLLVEAPLERAAEVNAALAGAGIFASEIRQEADSLESFFLEITGDALGDTPGDPGDTPGGGPGKIPAGAPKGQS
jgi:ABC-type multidrug transport system ATPase subunit